MRRPTITRRARWGVPAGALAVVGAVTAGLIVAANAQASPVLPVRTPAQLLAAVSGAEGTVPPFTGSVVETARLGLPDLPGLSSLGSMTSLLTGSNTVNIWYSNARHLRISIPAAMSESDFFVDGSSAWSWDSSGNDVTHYLLPANAKKEMPKLPTLTPQQAAQQVLAAVGPTTKVSLQSNISVAGQGAYQLVLAPKSSQSLVGQVRIAVDADHDIPLRVQVFARGATSPAFQVGFTSIAFVQPAASDLRFTVPPHAHVSTEKLGDQDMSGKNEMRGTDGGKEFGTGWLTVLEVSSADLSDGLMGLSGNRVQTGMFGSSSQEAPGTHTLPGQAVGNAAAGSAQYVAGQPSSGGPKGMNVSGLFGLAMSSATKVSGSWGSGRLLHTSLLSVLMTSNGQVYLGAVTPAVLYHDAAQGK